VATDVTATKSLADLEATTPEIDKEVSLYDSDGEIRVFWRARQFGTLVVVETRKPGKKPKLISIIDYGKDYSAEAWVEKAVKDREKRVPIIRKERAEAKIRQLIADTNTEILKLVAWSRNGSGNYLFSDRAGLLEDHQHWTLIQSGTEQEHITAIADMLRRKGGSYFGGIKLLRQYIEQIKPGGLADQTVQLTIEMIEKNLIPWPYVAGHLREPVMLSNEPRKLAVMIINKHTDLRHEDLGFYKEGTTAQSLVDVIYRQFVEDVKPSVLDALTLDH
jgi:hypothetical protein